METIANRLSQLLSALGIRQTQLANDLGITASSVSTMISGKSHPSSQTITAICRIYRVSEQWLRTGEGEMFLQRTPSSDLGEILAKSMDRNADEERARMMTLLSQLSDAEILLLSQLLSQLQKAYPGRQP